MLTDVLLVALGALVGVMNAVAGGGMLVGFPVLVALGMHPLLANATGILAVLPGQFTSAVGYRNYLRKVPLRYAWLLLPCAVGAAAGSLTLRHTGLEHFARIVPALVLFGVALFAFQPLLHAQLHRHMKRRSRKILPLYILGAALVPITFYGGYFGPGFGFIMLAFLGFTNLKDAHMINAMKNMAAVFVAGAAILCLSGSGLIQWHQGILMACGCALGGYFGARGAQRVSSHWLRIVIICIGLAAVVYLGIHDY